MNPIQTGRWLALSLLLLALPLAAADYEPPRTADGKPDLNGVWQVLNTANYGLEARDSRAALQMREGPVVPVPAKEVVALGTVGAVPASVGVVKGGKIPYQDWALKQRDENAANWLERDPEIKCYLPGIPRATYMPFPFQIFHNKDALVFSYEYAGAVRNVALSDLPQPDLCIRTGGDARISNFMLWHFAYTELYFCNTLWPDFNELEFARALADYSRCRRTRSHSSCR